MLTKLKYLVFLIAVCRPTLLLRSAISSPTRDSPGFNRRSGRQRSLVYLPSMGLPQTWSLLPARRARSRRWWATALTLLKSTR